MVRKRSQVTFDATDTKILEGIVEKLDDKVSELADENEEEGLEVTIPPTSEIVSSVKALKSMITNEPILSSTEKYFQRMKAVEEVERGPQWISQPMSATKPYYEQSMMGWGMTLKEAKKIIANDVNRNNMVAFILDWHENLMRYDPLIEELYVDIERAVEGKFDEVSVNLIGKLDDDMLLKWYEKIKALEED